MPYSLKLTDNEIMDLLANTINECFAVYSYRQRLPKYELQARLSVYRDLELIDERVFKYYWNLLNYEYDKNVTRNQQTVEPMKCNG